MLYFLMLNKIQYKVIAVANAPMLDVTKEGFFGIKPAFAQTSLFPFTRGLVEL